jgi:hypothetical protein
LLKENKKRFFVLTKEYDLWNVDDCFFLCKKQIDTANKKVCTHIPIQGHF